MINFKLLLFVIIFYSTMVGCRVKINPELHKAIETNKYKKALSILHKGTNINAVSRYNETALILAASKMITSHDKKNALEWYSFINVLLDKNADLSIRTRQGYHLLHFIVRSIYIKGEKLLSLTEKIISLGGDINVQTNYGQTPLHYAVQRRNSAYVDFLIKKGAKVSLKNKNGDTPINRYLRYNQNENIKIYNLLIQAGAKINHQNSSGTSALMINTLLGYNKIIQFLISKGAKVNLQDALGKSVLMHAVQFHHPKTVSLLLLNKADVFQKDKKGNTALHWTLIAEKKYRKIISLMGKNKVVSVMEKMLTDKKKKWLLIARMLIKKKADLSQKNKDGETVLSMAKRFENKEMIKLITQNSFLK